MVLTSKYCGFVAVSSVRLFINLYVPQVNTSHKGRKDERRTKDFRGFLVG